MPVVENRGEGIFLRFDESAVQAWEAAAVDNPVLAHRCVWLIGSTGKTAMSIPTRVGLVSDTYCSTRCRMP